MIFDGKKHLKPNQNPWFPVDSPNQNPWFPADFPLPIQLPLLPLPVDGGVETADTPKEAGAGTGAGSSNSTTSMGYINIYNRSSIEVL